MSTNFTRKTYVDFTTPVVDAQWLNGMQEKIDLTTDVADFAAVGDGVTNDYAAILDALNAAAILGREVHFDGTKTYLLGSELTIPAHSRIKTNGATFTTSLTTTGDTYLITVGNNTTIDELNVSIPSGLRRDRCILFDGDDIRVGVVFLSAVSVQTTPNANDGGIQILTGARNWFGLLRVTNYDRAINIGTTNGCLISRIEITGYVRGAYIYDNVGLTIQSGLVKTASANAGANPGHNGLLLESNSNDAQRNVLIENVVVEDSGEHAFRVGGDNQQSNLRFSNCSAYNVGGCGLKVLGTDSGIPTSVNRTLVIENFIAEDVGKAVTLDDPNRSGVLLKFCQYVQLTNTIVRKRNQAVSAQYGIVLDGTDFVHITNPLCMEATFDGIFLWSADGEVDYTSIVGGHMYANGRDGIRITVNIGNTSKRPTINDVTLDSNGGRGFNIIDNGTLQAALINARTIGNTGGMGACNDTTTMLQIVTTGADVAITPLSGVSALNSSTVSDGTNFSIRKAGSWVVL